MKNEREFGLPQRKLIQEEYIELISMHPKFDAAKEDLLSVWKEWRTGPETERGDVAPAAKEFVQHMTNWMKKNIK